MKILPINTKSKKYKIYIGNNVISRLSAVIKKEKINFKKILIIADKNVPKKLIKKINSKLKSEKKVVYFFKSSEKNKNFTNVEIFLKKLFSNNFSRNDLILCIGGGIAGDVTGFAASIYKRGLKFINIPSTLLSQVDSSIGGKTGVNNKFGKNLIGSFYQPDLVISDTKFLESLPKREIICGYAEILKHSLIGSKKLFLFLNKNLNKILKLKSMYLQKAILESCKIKKQIVEKDEKEKNIRKILNLGHTFGHAYEASLNYSKKLNHGEAVLLGINTAIKFSFIKKLLHIKEFNFIVNHFKKFELPFEIKNYFSPGKYKLITSFMTKDKKNKSDKINLILLKKIGHPIINKSYKKSVIENFIKKELSN